MQPRPFRLRINCRFRIVLALAAAATGAWLPAAVETVIREEPTRPCWSEPTIDCLLDEYRSLARSAFEAGRTIDWDEIELVLALDQLELAREAALAIDPAALLARTRTPSLREQTRRNHLIITRELTFVAVMNALLQQQRYDEAREVLMLTSGLGRIRGVIDFQAAVVQAGRPGLDAYPAARSNVATVQRDMLRDFSAGRWFGGEGYGKIGQHITIPAATSLARVGDLDEALSLAMAQNRAQGTGNPNAIFAMIRRLLAMDDTATVRGLADHMRARPDRFIELDHWTIPLAELAAYATRRGELEKARGLFAQVVEGFANHPSTPQRDFLLVALVTPEFAEAAPDAVRRLIYESKILNPAARVEAENRLARALQKNQDDTQLLAAFDEDTGASVARRADPAIRERMALALIRADRFDEAIELLRAGSSASARHDAVELLLARHEFDLARTLLSPADLPRFSVRLHELGHPDAARQLIESVWTTTGDATLAPDEVIDALLEVLGLEATIAKIEAIRNRSKRSEWWPYLGDALIDRGEADDAGAAYRRADLGPEEQARVDAYIEHLRSGQPAATVRYSLSESISDQAGQPRASEARVYPPLVPGLTPLEFVREITSPEYWESLSEEIRRALLLRAALALRGEDA